MTQPRATGIAFTAAGASSTGGEALPPRPRDDELDLFGITHPGRVRPENQDQFVLSTVHPQVVVHASSLQHAESLAVRGTRLATIMLVADGVGGSRAGSRASEVATSAVTRHIASCMRAYHTAGTADDGELVRTLHEAAIEAHEIVRTEADEQPDEKGMATTLSMAVIVWPWLYVVQLGDSRCYLYQDGRLRQISRDQTYAQDLVEQGVLSAEDAPNSPLSNILSSAIGASEAIPEITRVDVRRRGCVTFLCTDGLTKHVSDDEIAAVLGTMTASDHECERTCRELLQLALERGGSDNVTIVAGRALPLAAPA